MEDLRAITDPAERARRASEVIDELAAATGDASAVRLEALAEMQAAGISQADIARSTGISRARVGQLLRVAPPSGQQLLAPDPGGITVVMIQKRDADRGRLTVAGTTTTAFGKLADLAATYDLTAAEDQVPPPGIVDLNRPNLVVMIGPRSSALIAQALTADPVIKWSADKNGDWYITDTKTGEEYHSDFDRSWAGSDEDRHTCYAHIGRIRRPDGQGSWLSLSGEHAPGVAGAADLLCRDIASLWDQAHRSLWSAIVQVTADGNGRPQDVKLITPVYLHGRK